MPVRIAANVEVAHASLAAMAAYVPSHHALATKVVSIFPANRVRPTHQAIVCYFDPESGAPVALMDGSYITAMRTAAGSAVATRLMARKAAAVVSVIGTGVQARAHAIVLARAWPVQVFRIAGRDRAKVRVLCEDLESVLAVPVEPAPSIEDAVRSADIVCAATHAAEPILRRDWIADGTHINSVGFNAIGRGEIDAATIRDALVVVESRDAVLAPAPDGAPELRQAVEGGRPVNDLIHAEIGQLVAGLATGRTEDAQLTLYKSVGVAVQDVVAAALVFEAAQNRPIGQHFAI